jgi:hypothetical protein
MLIKVNPTTGGTLIRSTGQFTPFIFSGVFFTPPTTSIGVYYYYVVLSNFHQTVAFSLTSGTQQVVVKSPGKFKF